jgi:hypothetical protein
VNVVVKGSDSIAKLTDSAEFTSGKLDEFAKKVEELKKAAQSVNK